MFTNLYAYKSYDNIFVQLAVLVIMNSTYKILRIGLGLVFLLIAFQCKKTTPDTNQDSLQVNNVTAVTEEDISKFEITEYALSDQAENVTKDWNKFIELSTHIEDLKKGQLSFFKDDKTIMQGLLTDLKAEVPEQLNKPSILVRIAVLETTMSKLDEAANIKASSKETLIKNIENLLLSYNNFIYQINKEIERDSQVIIKP